MVQGADGDVREVDDGREEEFWKNPDYILRLIDLIFLTAEEDRLPPS